MSGTNGKSEGKTSPLDLEHELTAGEDSPLPRSAGEKDAGVGIEPGRDEELSKLRVERDALLDRLARLQADFENARKRAAKEQQDFRDFALADAIRTLLPILDSFERALQSDAQKSEFHNGVELIYKQLLDALAKLGLRPVPARGEIFDPHIHQAIEMVDTAEAEDQQVLDELQTGYKLKDRLLRPSMVRVARNSQS
ncbi:MAG: nucleotide exchange factor GrpE [Acidobacteria bacterium]|nr:nucleotide exchange factor GrpE [Acidobacteriota bacterium]